MKQVARGVLLVGALILIGAFLVIQLFPYGRDHTNLPVVSEPQWDNPQTRVLAKQACFDCHSNETIWPWYSNVAPVSWLVARDVYEGRQKINFSAWGGGEEADEIVEAVQKGEMPPSIYLITHPEARLKGSDLQAMAQGFTNTFGTSNEEEE